MRANNENRRNRNKEEKMKRACIGTLALALAAAGLSARAEDYYWNGDVREGAWETPGNWYHDDSFPNADDAVAIFSNWGDRTGTATVTVSGNYLFRWGSIGGSVKATLKGTGIDTSSLTFGTDLYDTLYLNAPQPAIFDNMRFVVNGAIAFANNSSIVLDNQAELDINRKDGLSLYNPCGFELTARLTTNYRALKTIYSQRKDHRLPEWREFCKEIEKLPYAMELIVGKEKSDV